MCFRCDDVTLDDGLDGIESYWGHPRRIFQSNVTTIHRLHRIEIAGKAN